MNRRIVIVDDEVQSPLSYFGKGLGDEIYSVNSLEALEPEKLKEVLTLSRGDGAMVVGGRAFEILKRFYHYGIRGENYWDCSRLCRLGIEGGAFIKVYHEQDTPTPEDIQFFMSPEFAIRREFPEYKYRVVKTYAEAKPFLEYFLGLPEDVSIGFDYEASGMAFDREFCITGASWALANKTWGLFCAVFFSFQDIRRRDSAEDYERFRKEFAEVIWKHQKNIWVFNLTYETQVTWREFGIECEFSDASVYNVIDGFHSKNFSLKWSAQRLLGGQDVEGVSNPNYGIEPWDTEFDYLEDVMSRLYFVDKFEKGKKKPVGRVMKCSEYDWQIQPEWKEVCQMYPDYVPEFVQLIQENFGNPFLNMPSDILGKYCCLDSFYTVLIHEENKDRYSELCRESFLNNQRIYSRNSRAGLYTDDAYISDYSRYAQGQMLWGILNVASYRCYTKIQKHLGKAAKIDRYPEFCKLLLSKNEFYQGNPGDIAKNILAQNVDSSDIYDTGLDEGMMVFKYGQKFTKGLVQIVKDSVTETKFKGKIDSSIARKKKILGVVAEKLVPFLGLDKIKLGQKHIELEKLLYYQKAYANLKNVTSQIPDVDHIPETFTWDGQDVDITSLTTFIMENYFRCTSPVDNEEIEKEFIDTFKLETVFLATIQRDVNKLPSEKRYYKNLGIKTPDEAYLHFCRDYEIYCNHLNQKTGVCIWPQTEKQNYPLEVFELANECWGDPMCDRNRDLWGDWKGWNVQEDFFEDHVLETRSEMQKPWTEADLTLPRFMQMRKLLINILLYKKYNKILSTYLNGLFVNGSRYVIETPQLIPLRDALPDEPGAVKKLFTKYDVMHKETKRSSSGYHKICGLL